MKIWKYQPIVFYKTIKKVASTAILYYFTFLRKLIA